VRFAILTAVLSALIFFGACQHYRDEKRVEQEERAAAVERVRAQQGDAAADKLRVPGMKEQVEDVPTLAPTPASTPNLLNRPVDAAGEPRE